MTLAQVADVVGGQLRDCDGSARITGAASDSSAAGAGRLFVAIAGERVDGHDYAGAAVAAGSPAVLAARPVGVPAVVVDDPVAALGRLAASVLADLRSRTGIQVVGITGSSGKTTTKDLMAQALGSAGTTVAPVGSLNTEVGLPVTVLEADDTTRYLVLEMSARGVGHIATLCSIAPPDVAVVLNVGTAHVGEFGSRDAVALAKSEIVRGLLPHGTAVLNADDERVAAMRAVAPPGAAVLTYAIDHPADVTGRDVTVEDAGVTRFVVSPGDVAFSVPVPGRHIAMDALAVAAACGSLGLSLAVVAEALSRPFARSRWRMEVRESTSGVMVVNDAYNANPESMRAAATAVRGMAARRRMWAVLGGMAELGASAHDEHRALGRWLSDAGVDRVVVVGDLGRDIVEGLPEADWVPDVDAALAKLRAELARGDVVLVKASRSERLERVALALTPDPAEPEGGTDA
jgi:UDP-N-acetylmuramoyl-tripeptide--D-alanyl-D-alanine ligase